MISFLFGAQNRAGAGFHLQFILRQPTGQTTQRVIFLYTRGYHSSPGEIATIWHSEETIQDKVAWKRERARSKACSFSFPPGESRQAIKTTRSPIDYGRAYHCMAVIGVSPF